MDRAVLQHAVHTLNGTILEEFGYICIRSPVTACSGRNDHTVVLKDSHVVVDRLAVHSETGTTIERKRLRDQIIPLIHGTDIPQRQQCDTINGIDLTIAIKVINRHLTLEAFPHGVEGRCVLIHAPGLVAVCCGIVHDAQFVDDVVTGLHLVIEDLFSGGKQLYCMSVVVAALLPGAQTGTALCTVQNPDLFTCQLCPAVAQCAVHTVDTCTGFIQCIDLGGSDGRAIAQAHTGNILAFHSTCAGITGCDLEGIGTLIRAVNLTIFTDNRLAAGTLRTGTQAMSGNHEQGNHSGRNCDHIRSRLILSLPGNNCRTDTNCDQLAVYIDDNCIIRRIGSDFFGCDLQCGDRRLTGMTQISNIQSVIIGHRDIGVERNRLDLCLAANGTGEQLFAVLSCGRLLGHHTLVPAVALFRNDPTVLFQFDIAIFVSKECTADGAGPVCAVALLRAGRLHCISLVKNMGVLQHGKNFGSGLSTCSTRIEDLAFRDLGRLDHNLSIVPDMRILSDVSAALNVADLIAGIIIGVTGVNTQIFHRCVQTEDGTALGVAVANVCHLHGFEAGIEGCTVAGGILGAGRFLSAAGHLLRKRQITDLNAIQPEAEHTVHAAQLIVMILRNVELAACQHTGCIVRIGNLVIGVVRCNRCIRSIRCIAALLAEHHLTVDINIDKGRVGILCSRAEQSTNLSTVALEHDLYHPIIGGIQRNALGHLHDDLGRHQRAILQRQSRRPVQMGQRDAAIGGSHAALAEVPGVAGLGIGSILPDRLTVFADQILHAGRSAGHSLFAKILVGVRTYLCVTAIFAHCSVGTIFIVGAGIDVVTIGFTFHRAADCALAVHIGVTGVNAQVFHRCVQTEDGTALGVAVTNVCHLHGLEAGIEGGAVAGGILGAGRFLSVAGVLLRKRQITDLNAIQPEAEHTVHAAQLIVMILRNVELAACQHTGCIVRIGNLVIGVVRCNRCIRSIRCIAALLAEHHLTVDINIDKGRVGILCSRAEQSTNLSTVALEHDLYHPIIGGIQRNALGHLHDDLGRHQRAILQRQSRRPVQMGQRDAAIGGSHAALTEVPGVAGFCIEILCFRLVADGADHSSCTIADAGGELFGDRFKSVTGVQDPAALFNLHGCLCIRVELAAGTAVVGAPTVLGTGIILPIGFGHMVGTDMLVQTAAGANTVHKIMTGHLKDPCILCDLHSSLCIRVELTAGTAVVSTPTVLGAGRILPLGLSQILSTDVLDPFAAADKRVLKRSTLTGCAAGHTGGVEKIPLRVVSIVLHLCAVHAVGIDLQSPHSSLQALRRCVGAASAANMGHFQRAEIIRCTAAGSVLCATLRFFLAAARLLRQCQITDLGSVQPETEHTADTTQLISVVLGNIKRFTCQHTGFIIGIGHLVVGVVCTDAIALVICV